MEISQIDSKDHFKVMHSCDENRLIHLVIRYAPDKSYETILNKLSRKNNEMTDKTIPWFVNLIKDAKRLSILFESEEDIWN